MIGCRHVKLGVKKIIFTGEECHSFKTGPAGVVTKSSANRLVGAVFASRYLLQPRVSFQRPK